jgi:hypothetical protein
MVSYREDSITHNTSKNELIKGLLYRHTSATKKELDERLEILRRLGQRLELRDGVLAFELADHYLSLKWVRDAEEQKYRLCCHMLSSQLSADKNTMCGIGGSRVAIPTPASSVYPLR